jgi:glutaredoxin
MKLYTKTVCPKCIWIKSELQRSPFPVDIVNIDHDEQAREHLIGSGLMSVPVLEVDGKFIVSPEEMMRQLEEMSR